MVQLLEQPSLGVEGGAHASVRFEGGFKGPGSSLWMNLQLNDAEQLALYPFARDWVCDTATIPPPTADPTPRAIRTR